jgi:hypothetical protein
MGFLGAGLLKRNRAYKNVDQQTLDKTFLAVFDEKEKVLIRLISENSLKSTATSIEDINRILGLSEKPQDLQKKHRSDIISSINQKYHYVTRTKSVLLKKNRAEMDKRSFEYYIDFEDIQSLNSLI